MLLVPAPGRQDNLLELGELWPPAQFYDRLVGSGHQTRRVTGAAGLFDRSALPYFSVDSAWYHLMAARLQLQVLSAGKFDANGCFVLLPADIVAAPVDAGQVRAELGNRVIG